MCSSNRLKHFSVEEDNADHPGTQNMENVVGIGGSDGDGGDDDYMSMTFITEKEQEQLRRKKAKQMRQAKVLLASSTAVSTAGATDTKTATGPLRPDSSIATILPVTSGAVTTAAATSASFSSDSMSLSSHPFHPNPQIEGSEQTYPPSPRAKNSHTVASEGDNSTNVQRSGEVIQALEPFLSTSEEDKNLDDGSTSGFASSVSVQHNHVEVEESAGSTAANDVTATATSSEGVVGSSAEEQARAYGEYQKQYYLWYEQQQKEFYTQRRLQQQQKSTYTPHQHLQQQPPQFYPQQYQAQYQYVNPHPHASYVFPSPQLSTPAAVPYVAGQNSQQTITDPILRRFYGLDPEKDE